MILLNTKKIVLSTSVVLWILLTMTKLSYAADDAPLFSLDNTNFVVSLAFIAFVAILLYFKVQKDLLGWGLKTLQMHFAVHKHPCTTYKREYEYI